MLICDSQHSNAYLVGTSQVYPFMFVTLKNARDSRMYVQCRTRTQQMTHNLRPVRAEPEDEEEDFTASQCLAAYNVSPNAHLEVLNEVPGILPQLPIENRFTTSLQQQQLIKRLEDVDAGLVNGADNSSACVDNVAHCPHDDGSSPRIQTCDIDTFSACYCHPLW